MHKSFYYINRMIFLAAIIVSALAAVIPLSCSDAAELAFEIRGVDAKIAERLTDGNYNTYASLGEDASIELLCEKEIGSAYIVFDRVYGEFSLTDPDTGKSVRCGENGFLHTFLDVRALLGENVRRVKLDFDTGEISLADLYLFGKGEVPAWVQKWKKPADGDADLLLFSSHSDDEQLFFAGILPYYAGERGLNVQVVYFTNHYDVHNRPHEQLNGLWTVGVTVYPVIGELPDLYSESLDTAIAQYRWAGYGEDDIVGIQVELIRRFKPFVVVGHDVNGEYGHGAHRLNTYTLRQALELSGDKESYHDSAEKYGTWDVPKTYLHLWGENKIVMDWDEPLDSFGGRTAFEMTVEGYGCHLSQHWTWFTRWLKGTDYAPITAASQIKTYSPCEYGLYRTTVGADAEKNDFFENVDLKKTASEPAAPKQSEKMQLAAIPGSLDKDGDFGEPSDVDLSRYYIVFALCTAALSVLAIVLFRKRIFKTEEK